MKFVLIAWIVAVLVALTAGIWTGIYAYGTTADLEWHGLARVGVGVGSGLVAGWIVGGVLGILAQLIFIGSIVCESSKY